MAFIFPTHIFNPSVIKPTRVRRILSGGAPINGADEDVIQVDGGGLWQWTLSGIELYSPDLLRLWNAWDAHLAGGSVECWVPIASNATAPQPGGVGPSPIVADDPMFPTSVGYSIPYIKAQTTSAASLRATTVALSVSKGARVKGGEEFSVMHEKGPGLYTITRVVSASGQSATVNIWPPLREAIPSGLAVNFDWPMFRARMIPNFDMTPQITLGLQATVEVSFIEVAT